MKVLRYGLMLLAVAVFIAGCAKTVQPVTAPPATTAAPAATTVSTTSTAAAPVRAQISPWMTPTIFSTRRLYILISTRATSSRNFWTCSQPTPNT